MLQLRAARRGESCRPRSQVFSRSVQPATFTRGTQLNSSPGGAASFDAVAVLAAAVFGGRGALTGGWIMAERSSGLRSDDDQVCTLGFLTGIKMMNNKKIAERNTTSRRM